MREVRSGYRFYNPDISRWLKRDLIRENGGVNLYAFVQNAPVFVIDWLGLLFVPMNPPPAWFNQFDSEGKACCCDREPEVTLTIRDAATWGWDLRVVGLVDHSGCVAEVRWTWATCDRYRTMSPWETGQSGFFPGMARNLVEFEERLAPRPILNVWLTAAWLECEDHVWQRKSGTIGHGYDAGSSWNPLDFFRRWLQFTGERRATF